MEQAVNLFNKGMSLDTHPMVQGNNTLTDCLNGTLVTMQGNEVILQNDMGNRRIDNAYLPSGYEPVGIKEYGGVIYVAAYNPITNHSLIGSFPSPERKIDVNDDESLQGEFNFNNFFNPENIEDDDNLKIKVLKNDSYLKLLTKDKTLHVGDKFTVYSPELSSMESDITNYRNITNDSENTKAFTDWKNCSELEYAEISDLLLKKLVYQIKVNESWQDCTQEEYNAVDENKRRILYYKREYVIDKVYSPKNRKYTLHLGILNNQNNFNDITNSLVRWENTTITKEDGSIYTDVGKIINLENKSDIYKFNKGYFIPDGFVWDVDIEGKTIDDKNLIKSRKQIAANTFSYKLAGPLYLKVDYNHISNFSYDIRGKQLSEGNIELTVTGYFTYNCPDEIEGSPVTDNDYYTFGIQTETFDPSFSSPIDFDFYEYLKDEDKIELKDPISLTYSNHSYNKTTNLYKLKLEKKYNISYDASSPEFTYVIGVQSGGLSLGDTVYLKGLSDKGTINLNLINSGELNLNQYKFYNDLSKDSSTGEEKLDTLMILNFESYPKEGESLEDLTLVFKNINENDTSDLDKHYLNTHLPLLNGVNLLNFNWKKSIIDENGDLFPLLSRMTYSVQIQYTHKGISIESLQEKKIKLENNIVTINEKLSIAETARTTLLDNPEEGINIIKQTITPINELELLITIEINQLNSEIKELNNLITSINNQIAVIENDIIIKTAEKDASDDPATKARLQEEIDALETQKDTLDSERESYEGQIDDKEDEIDALNVSLDNKIVEVFLGLTLEEAKEELSRLRIKLDSLEKQLATIDKQLVSYRIQLETIISQLGIVVTTISELEEQGKTEGSITEIYIEPIERWFLTTELFNDLYSSSDIADICNTEDERFKKKLIIAPEININNIKIQYSNIKSYIYRNGQYEEAVYAINQNENKLKLEQQVTAKIDSSTLYINENLYPTYIDFPELVTCNPESDTSDIVEEIIGNSFNQLLKIYWPVTGGGYKDLIGNIYGGIIIFADDVTGNDDALGVNIALKESDPGEIIENRDIDKTESGGEHWRLKYPWHESYDNIGYRSDPGFHTKLTQEGTCITGGSNPVIVSIDCIITSKDDILDASKQSLTKFYLIKNTNSGNLNGNPFYIIKGSNGYYYIILWGNTNNPQPIPLNNFEVIISNEISNPNLFKIVSNIEFKDYIKEFLVNCEFTDVSPYDSRCDIGNLKFNVNFNDKTLDITYKYHNKYLIEYYLHYLHKTNDKYINIDTGNISSVTSYREFKLSDFFMYDSNGLLVLNMNKFNPHDNYELAKAETNGGSSHLDTNIQFIEINV